MNKPFALPAPALATLLIFAWPGLCEAATDVGGILNASVTWSVSGSPYRLSANVQISYGATLTIDPGVRVEGNGRNLQIFGGLVVAGSASSPTQFVDVRFLGATGNSQSTPYSIDMRYAQIQGGAFLPPTGNATYGAFALRDSTLTDLTDYTYVWYPTSDCYFERNQFIRTYGISIGHNGPSVYVRNNLFFQTKAAFSGYPAVQNWAAYAGRTVVELNSFQDLKTYAVALQYSDGAMSAQNNYWGTNDATAIAAMILDRNDDLSIGGAISFQPILAAPNSFTPALLVQPSISLQPENVSIVAGLAATFSVVAAGSAPLSYQWRKDGVAITGATSATLTLNSVPTSAAGGYTVVVTNNAGSITSNVGQLIVVVTPVIALQPDSQSTLAGANASFSVSATGTAPFSYQWRKDGVAISGATSATLTLSSVQFSDSGNYSVTVSNAAGSVASNTAALSVVSPGRFINLSVLAPITAADDSFSLGYVVSGAIATNAKLLVIRAAGPSLGALGVPGTLVDPKLELFAGATKTGENDDWGGSATTSTAMAAVGGFAYTGPASHDAALVASITSRDNSVKISAGTSAPNGTGAVIAEVYDATANASFTTTTPRFINFSVLKNVGASVTLGFVIGGSTNEAVLVRAVGPSLGLAPFNLGGVMADPKVELFDGSGKSLATSDNWSGTATLTAAFNHTGAFTLPSSSKDAALVATLTPGNYSIVVTPVTGTASGMALLEVYEVP